MNFIKNIFKKFKKPTFKARRRIMPNSTVIIEDNGTNVLDVDLLKNTDTENKKKVRQYTKVALTSMLVAALFWITWSYAMATYSLIVLCNPDPLTSLSEKVCQVILGSIISYMAKAFLETFAEKTTDAIVNNLNIEPEYTFDDDEPVG